MLKNKSDLINENPAPAEKKLYSTIVRARPKKCVLTMSHHHLMMIWGGISYVDFDTELRHKSHFCFQDNWDILNFVPAHYFFFETHWAKQFFYKTLVGF